MSRRKVSVVVSIILCACLLSACSISISSNSSSSSSASSGSSSSGASYSQQSTEDESSSVSTGTSGSNDVKNDLNSPVTSSSTITSEDENSIESSSDITSGEDEKETSTDGLVMYSSIYDIPFADLEYANDRNSLSLDGESWVSAPGASRLGDLCFTDGKILIIQCFYGDLTNFAWFTASFNSGKEAPLFPVETYNKLFIRAEGYTLYTDDGYQYTIENP